MRIFKGIVENNNDPKGRMRLKVRVQGIHHPDSNVIDTKHLPWAEVQGSTGFGVTSKLGFSSLLPVGQWVYVQFLDDDTDHPIVTGTVYSNGSLDQNHTKDDTLDEFVRFETKNGTGFTLNDKTGDFEFHHGDHGHRGAQNSRHDGLHMKFKRSPDPSTGTAGTFEIQLNGCTIRIDEVGVVSIVGDMGLLLKSTKGPVTIQSPQHVKIDTPLLVTP